MAKRKVDVKLVAKTRVMGIVKTALQGQYRVSDGENYGMSDGTIVVHTENTDVQVRPIAPKAGVARYTELEVEAVVPIPVEVAEEVEEAVLAEEAVEAEPEAEHS